MCGNPEDLRSKAEWDGIEGDSRRTLLVQLQREYVRVEFTHHAQHGTFIEYISPSLMIPQRRLETLLTQAKLHQQRQCPFHSTSSDLFISLLSDCHCASNSFPSITTHVLTEHTDEIWRLEFSHNGKYLATAGKDKSVIIWNVDEDFSVEWKLKEHSDPVSCIAWSPDDSILLSSAETILKMWNTKVREIIVLCDDVALMLLIDRLALVLLPWLNTSTQ